MKVTILGCGGSGGVPLAIGDPRRAWGSCDPKDPRNRRRRGSILVEVDGRSLLIDTSPDLREQILDNEIARLHAVLFTHAHADHCHGLDDLRALTFGRPEPIPAYMDRPTHEALTARFDYAFVSSHPLSKLYPALMDDRPFDYGPFEAAGVPVVAFRQDHGNIESAGFRIGPMAYSTDVVTLDEAAFACLEGVRLWIVDCLRFEPHPTHAHFDRVMEWVERLRPERTLLTHMNHTLDYEILAARCPEGVEPAIDGLSIVLDA